MENLTEVNPVKLTQLAMKKTAVESIFHHILPIVYKMDEIEDPIGTATLIKDGLNYYIITAAHVLLDKRTQEHIHEKIGTPIEGSWVPFRGMLFHTKIDGVLKGSQDDHIDLAIFKINDDIRQIIETKYVFYDMSGKSTKPELLNGIRYVVAGFPADSYEKYGNHVFGKCFGFLTTSNDVVKCGFSKHENIALNYDTTALVNVEDQESVYGFYPDGMSGGLIAYFPRLIGSGNLPYLLVGTLIEYKSDQELIIATKISVTFALIEKHIIQTESHGNGIKISGMISPLLNMDASN